MAHLEQTLLGEEIRVLAADRRSGILAVTQPEPAVTKALFFRRGRIVFASSTLEKDKLGESLIRLGRISRADFAAAYETSQDKKQRFGSALVSAGLMTEEELGRAVAQQVQRIGVSLFAWTRGETRFHAEDDAIPEDLAVDISTDRLLFEGARIFPDTARLEAALGDLDRALCIATRPPFDYSQLAFSPAEKAVLEEAADEVPIAKMLDGGGQPRPLRARAVYTLLSGGILDEVVHDAQASEVAREERPFVEGEGFTFKVAVAVRDEPPPSDAREQILQLYESLPRATHYAVLGVPPDADAGAVDAAYRHGVTEQDRTWRALMGDVQLTSVLSTLRFRRREAYQILSDPLRRAAYDEALGSLSPPKARAEVTAEDHTQVVRLQQQARGLVESGDRAGAIALLLEGLALDPQDRPSRRLLALTLSQHPPLFRTAERHFLTALEQDPHDIELRYRLAGYYRKAGLPARALGQLNVLLSHHPRHEESLRDREALQAELGRRPARR